MYYRSLEFLITVVVISCVVTAVSITVFTVFAVFLANETLNEHQALQHPTKTSGQVTSQS